MTAPSQQDLIHIWEKAKHCLPLLEDARIFITGGTGFFGRWLLESLFYANEKSGYHIEAVVLARQPDLFLQKAPHFKDLAWLKFLAADVQHFEFPAGEFSHVIHGATQASARLNREDPLLMLDTIITGTRRVLEFAVQVKAQHFLQLSSGGVYGRQPPTLIHIDESYSGGPDPLLLLSAHGVGKLTAEHLCFLFAKQYSLNIKIARCFAFVGPFLPLDTHFAIGNFIRNVLNKQTIRIEGDGSPYRSYLYAADLVIWLWTILCFGQSGQAYNVGSDEPITIAELARLVGDQVEPRLAVEMAKKRDVLEPAERYVPSIARAKTELGLQQWIDLPDAIRRTLQWNVTA